MGNQGNRWQVTGGVLICAFLLCLIALIEEEDAVTLSFTEYGPRRDAAPNEAAERDQPFVESLLDASELAEESVGQPDNSSPKKMIVAPSVEVSHGSREPIEQSRLPEKISFDIWGLGKNRNASVKCRLEERRSGLWISCPQLDTKTRSKAEPLVWNFPNLTFRVRAIQLGFETEFFGPFEPGEVGDSLRLDLKPYPRVKGRVLLAGLPVRNAVVSLKGARKIFGPDRNGRFEFACENPIRAPVVATHPRLGRIASKKIARPFSGSVEVILTYSELGSLMGRVLVSTQTQGDQKVIYLFHNKSQDVVSAKLDRLGRFEIKTLQPGLWSLSLSSPRLTNARVGSWGDRGEKRATLLDQAVPNASRSIEISAGEVAVVELDFREEPGCFLYGAFHLRMRPEWSWNGTICCFDGVPVQDEARLEVPSNSALVSNSRIDKGAFVLSARDAGPYRLRGSLRSGEGLRIEFWTHLNLRLGKNKWRINNTAGRLILSTASRKFRPNNRYRYLWSDQKGSFASSEFVLGDGTTGVIVPSGRVEIFVREGRRRERLLQVVNVRPDEDVHLVLPLK